MKSLSFSFPASISPQFALVAVTIAWGATFWIAQQAVNVSGPLTFVAGRFGVGAILAAIICRDQMRGITKLEISTGMLIGLSIFGGYSLMTWGLTLISSSKSAFITAFYVPTVPLLQWFLLKQKPHRGAWAAICTASIGLFLLNGVTGLSPNFGAGEVVTSIAAIVFAFEIILISRAASRLNIARVTFVQLATASVLAALMIPVLQEPLPIISNTFLVCILTVGCASGLIQYVMNWAQKWISATKATLIYSGEPIWAGFIGHFAGEHQPGSAVVGVLLIVFAGIFSEWRPKKNGYVKPS